jgi:hypothetical protein
MVKRQGGSKSSRKRQSEVSAARPEAPQVTSEEALKFIEDMQREFKTAPRTKIQKVKLQEYLAQFTDAQLKAIGRRVQSDLMFGPARTVNSEDFKTDPPQQSGSRKKSKATPLISEGNE